MNQGDWEVVSRYTREDMLEDGSLVDVTTVAREAGFKHHTAVTRNVWDRCVAVPDENLQGIQDEQGRLWDVLWLASVAARGNPDRDLVEFRVSVVDSRRPNGSVRQVHTLWLHIGPGDEGEPVLTIIFPEDY